jgi:ornithine lipid hydroxylase
MKPIQRNASDTAAAITTTGTFQNVQPSAGEAAPRARTVWGQLVTVLPWTSYWIIMGLSFGLTAWLAQPNRMPHYVWYVMAQVNVLLVLLFEELIPRKRENSLFRDGQSWNDIGHMLFFKLGIRPLIWMLALFIVTVVASHWHNNAGIWPSHLNVVLQFLLLILGFDLIGYCYHRVLHRFDFLFAFHSLHHDTPHMHVLKANRLHVGEEVINFMLLVPALILVGCPTQMVIWLGMWEVFEGNLSHSNVDQRFPHWFHYIVRTVDVHYIHHSVEGRQQNSNFGGLPIWDLVFGTYRHPFDAQVSKTGLEGYPIPRSFLGQLWFPFRKMLFSKTT